MEFQEVLCIAGYLRSPRYGTNGYSATSAIRKMSRSVKLATRVILNLNAQRAWFYRKR